MGLLRSVLGVGLVCLLLFALFPVGLGIVCCAIDYWTLGLLFVGFC